MCQHNWPLFREAEVADFIAKARTPDQEIDKDTGREGDKEAHIDRGLLNIGAAAVENMSSNVGRFVAAGNLAEAGSIARGGRRTLTSI